MSKRTKLLAATMATMMMATVFAGCGEEKKDDSNGGSSSTEFADKLVVWDHLTVDEHDALDPIIQAWGKENGVEITFNNDQNDMQGYMDAAKSSSGPALYFGISADNLGTGQKAGYLEKVPSDLIDESKYGSEAALTAAQWNGDYYAVPIAQECVALFYNTDKSAEVPATMEDLVKAAKGGLGFEYDITNFYNSFAMLSAQGGYVFKTTDGATDVEDIGLGNEGAIKGLEFMKSLVDDGLMAADISADKARDDFKSGASSFYISGPWDVATFQEAGVNFKVAPIPTINGKSPAPFLGVQCAFVNSQAGDKEKNTAWALLEYLMNSDEVANVLLEKGNRLPVTNSVIESESFQANEIMAGFVEQAKNAIPTPNVKEVQYMWEPGANAIKNVLQGKQTPEEAGAKIVEDMKAQM